MAKTAQEIEALQALSPLDGRYAEATAALRPHFSEAALIRERVRIEIDWLLFLAESEDVEDCKRMTKKQVKDLTDLRDSFALRDAVRVKALERKVRHDVKAVELFLGEALRKRKMDMWIPWLHFGCTSEDINSAAHARMVMGALHGPVRDALCAMLQRLDALVEETATVPMLARTHGQPASPTTMGKEFAVFVDRLRTVAAELAELKMSVKFGGATGNFSAWTVACPEADWLKLTRAFLREAAPECEPLDVTTQIDPHDSLGAICLSLVRLAAVMIDLARDMWQYISDGYLSQRAIPGRVGSSAMPHKVNPIDFENAEGNLGIAQALLIHFAAKLPVSRLQRDLSDSTVMRSVGVAFGHLHLALGNLKKGLDLVDPDAEAMRRDLSGHWEVLAEPIQTVLRRHGVSGAYEKLRLVTQGRELDEAAFRTIVKKLPIPKETKARLAALRPETYIGRAADLARLNATPASAKSGKRKGKR
jgi:adenylosuccinate lyase